MLQLNRDPVWRTSTLSTFVNEVTLQRLFPRYLESSMEGTYQQHQIEKAADHYKNIAKLLQWVWWDGQDAPPLYRQGFFTYINASPELEELLSLDVSGTEAARAAEQVWRSQFRTQPLWDLVKGTVAAFNNVLQEKGGSRVLAGAQGHVVALVSWFQNLVRSEQNLHALLLDELMDIYGKEDAQRRYARYLELMKRFTALASVAAVEVPKTEEESQPQPDAGGPEKPAGGKSVTGFLSVMAAVATGAYFISRKYG